MTVNLDSAARKVSTISGMLHRRRAEGRVLVVGCGDGREAGQLARQLHVDVVGIDIGTDSPFAHQESAPATLLVMDGQALDFDSQSFDVIYSFHALEHIADPRRALDEMRRVLRPGGTYLIGTPNKARAVGYVGSASPVLDRIKWNIADWRARAAGRWSNAKGAHAGFTSHELLEMCAETFGEAADVSDEYYLHLYASRTRFIRLLMRTRLSRWVYPAVYVAGRG